MSSKIIYKNAHGKQIGYTKYDAQNRITAYKTTTATKVASYDPHTNTTKDAKGTKVGTGNLVTNFFDLE